ncbi:hypothetical protein pEaSNUABM52_00009 [Erwinia phage pEp_SNUABM_52]|nr:hypothetical protein pEaSNUABM52_00009 [Erwinia phage pEp_SNUABM_52]
MIPLRPTKTTSPNVCREDLRVLSNLTDMNVVLAVKYLANMPHDKAKALLASLRNEEVTQLYNFSVPQ